MIDNYPEGQVEEFEAVNNPEDPAAGTRKFRSRASCGSSARTSWRTRRPSSSALRPVGKCACAAPTSSPADVVEGRRRQRRRAALHLRPGHTRRRFTRRATAEGDSPLAVGRHAVPAEIRLYDHLFSTRPRRAADDLLADLNPASEVIVQGFVEPSLAEPLSARPSNSSDSATSAPIRTRRREAGLQPDGDAQGHLGQGAGARLNAQFNTGATARNARRCRAGGGAPHPDSVQRSAWPGAGARGRNTGRVRP